MAIIDRIKHNLRTPNELVWKWRPDYLSGQTDNITMGSQLIVNESQEAIFFKGGQALDSFGPGTHTLSTKNLPILKSLVNIPFGHRTPFSAEIFFVNKAANLNYKWGTQNPIPIEDPKMKVLISIGCYGQFGLRVSDSRVFVTQIVGTLYTWNTEDILKYFRGAVLTRVKDTVANYVVQNNQSLLSITARVDEISKLVEQRLKDEFSKYGLELLRFFIDSITIPDEEIKKIQKGGFERLEIEQIGEERYKMKRSLDIMQSAASNTSSAGTLMSAGVGLGVGAAMAKPFAEKVQDTFKTDSTSNTPSAKPLNYIECPQCKAKLPEGTKFCSGCGAKITLPINCPKCNQVLNGDEKFCSGCGTKIISATNCPNCGANISPGMNFCSQCGKPIV